MRAQFIERNCEINKEFPAAHPRVKCNINRINRTLDHFCTTFSLTQWATWWTARWTWWRSLEGNMPRLMLTMRYVKFISSSISSGKGCKRSENSYRKKIFDIFWKRLNTERMSLQWKLDEHKLVWNTWKWILSWRNFECFQLNLLFSNLTKMMTVS